MYFNILFVCLCVGLGLSTVSTQRVLRDDRLQPTYGVSNSEIRRIIHGLVKTIKNHENNLYVHESRERQTDDFVTKTLNSLNSDHALTEKNMIQMAQHLVKMEEKIIATEELIRQNDNQQFKMLSKISDDLSKLAALSVNLIGPPPDAVPSGNCDTSNVIKQIAIKDDTLLEKVNELSDKIESVDGKVVEMKMAISSLTSEIEDSKIDEISEDISGINDAINDIKTTTAILKKSDKNCEDMNKDVVSRLEKLDELYQQQDEDIKQLSKTSKKAFETENMALGKMIDRTVSEDKFINGSVLDILQKLKDVTAYSQKQIEKLGENVKGAINESTQLLKGDVSSVSDKLQERTGHIIDALDDTGSQVDNLQHLVSENHDEMQDGIKSIGKVEKVMINTADAVLETKRSIEFGIKQVILELSDIVKNSGSTINTTLSDQIRNISFDIIKNQTTALTNMTAKVETEISQVWRQISIMYDQMTQTVDLLDDLQNTTKSHMNQSLSHVGSMDGTVGKINNKVAGVENNLNFLLGRLSLVVSEFNNMKQGVGHELEKLRTLAKEPVFKDLAATIDPTVKVNHRRHAKFQPLPTPKPIYYNPYNDPYYGQVLPEYKRYSQRSKNDG